MLEEHALRNAVHTLSAALKDIEIHSEYITHLFYTVNDYFEEVSKVNQDKTDLITRCSSVQHPGEIFRGALIDAIEQATKIKAKATVALGVFESK